jgi:hypothetical protein
VCQVSEWPAILNWQDLEGMSAIGPEQTLSHVRIESAVEGKADIRDPMCVPASIGGELNEFSVAEEFKRPVWINGEMHPGIRWELVSKPPGSRVTGFALMRERLIATAPRPDSRVREKRGLFVVKEDCPNFVRTIPVLPRSPKNPDDVDSEGEDHIFDAVKYMLQADRSPLMTSRRIGW